MLTIVEQSTIPELAGISKHGDYDPVRKRFYNAKTGKFVKRLRESAVGKTLGKSIGKTKGKTYLEIIEDFKKADIPLGLRVWIPEKLTREILRDALEQYSINNIPAWRYSVDRAIATLNLIITQRYKSKWRAKKSKKARWEKGWTQVHHRHFRKSVHSTEYLLYLSALEEAGIIEIDDKYYHPATPTKNAVPCTKRYRILPEWHETWKKNKLVSYEEPAMLMKAYAKKDERIRMAAISQTRLRIIKEGRKLFGYIDTMTLEKRISRRKKFKGIFKSDELYHWIEQIQNHPDDFFANGKDLFGHRLHTPWTSLRGIVKKYIKHPDDIKMVELDIANSQFQFLAMYATCDTETLLNLFADAEDWFLGQLKKDIAYLKQMYNDSGEFREFVDASLKGDLYVHLERKFADAGVKVTSRGAKKLCFRALFSDETQSTGSKKKLSQVFPVLVEVCNKLNKNKSKAIPRMLQRLESKMIIDHVCANLHKVNIVEFFTIHDSIMLRADNEDMARKIFKETFETAGLHVPVIKPKKESNTE